MGKASLVVLISGSGSNLQAIIDAIKTGYLQAEIKAVISNSAAAGGLERAARENITTYVIDHKKFPSRGSFDQAMMQLIDPINPELVILAGFMRILSSDFIKRYRHRLINVHPSLLPKYKGLNTHQLAIDNHDTIHGASVHYVTDELDSGPVVIQAQIAIDAGDTAETLAARILIEEHKIYPMLVKMHCEGRITFDKNHLQLDNQTLDRPLLWEADTLTQ